MPLDRKSVVYELKNTYGMEVVAVPGYNLTVRQFRGNYEVEYAHIIKEGVE